MEKLQCVLREMVTGLQDIEETLVSQARLGLLSPNVNNQINIFFYLILNIEISFALKY